MVVYVLLNFLIIQKRIFDIFYTNRIRDGPLFLKFATLPRVESDATLKIGLNGYKDH